jgi:hypothetical protein
LSVETHDHGIRLPAGSWLEKLFKLANQSRDADPDVLKVAPAELLASLPERYVQGKAGVHVHLRFRAIGVESEPREICATFNRAFDDRFKGLNIDCLEEAQRRHEGLVLVEIREDAQVPQDGVLGVPSLVRLLPLDECPSRPVAFDSVEWSRTAIGGAINYVPKEIPLIRVDRELVMAARRSVIRDDQLPNGMVERGAQIVDDRVLSGLGVVIDRKGIGTWFEESLGRLVERSEIFPCSLDLGVAAV